MVFPQVLRRALGRDDTADQTLEPEAFESWRTRYAGEIIGTVAGEKVSSRINGVLRGLIRSETTVTRGLKIGDVDPRGQKHYCYTISEKARAIGGSVLEAVLRVFN